MRWTQSQQLDHQKLDNQNIQGRLPIKTRSNHLGILVLSELLVLALELYRDLVPLLLPSVLDDSLHDSTRIVLEHDVLDVPADQAHERTDMFLAFG